VIIRPGILAILVLVTAAAALAQPGGNPPGSADKAKTAPANPPGTHTLNLKDADIQVLIATVSEITGKNFIIGPNVQGKVTVVSARRCSPTRSTTRSCRCCACTAIAAMPSGSMVKIVAEATAQQDGSGGSTAAQRASRRLVTQIVPLKHVLGDRAGADPAPADAAGRAS
jgi:general secretion pathway protein D